MGNGIIGSNTAGIDSVIGEILKKAFYGRILSNPIVGIETELGNFRNYIGSVYGFEENQERNSNHWLSSVLAHKDDDNSIHNVEIYEAQIGRPMATFDSSHSAKYDAIGWLKTVSELPINPQKKPIIVIENITNISSPEVRDILIHSWLNGERTSIDNRPNGDGKPLINPQNYTIVFTWQSGTLNKLSEVWPDYDKYLIIRGLEQESKNFKDKYKLENYDADKTKRWKDILSRFCNE